MIHLLQRGLLGVTVILGLTHCAGYTIGDQKPQALAKVKRLYVPVFVNQTLEPRLGALVTQAVVKQLQMGSDYVISDEASADAVLKGTVGNINRSQFRSDPNNVLKTSQLLLILGVSYEIMDLQSQKKLFVDQVSADSPVILDLNLQISETQALEDAAQRIAARLCNNLSMGW
jgi:Lipopolysaccharide-assembly